MNILKAQNSIITLEDGRGTGDCGRDIYLRWHSETEAQTQDLSAMFENARLFIYTWNSLLTWLSSTVRKNYHLTTQHIPTKVCFAAREWFDFWRHPVAARPGPAAHVFLVVNILVSKNSGYLLNKYFKYALRQCPKSFNTTIQMWTAAPPPPPSCRPESQHQAKIIK